MNKVITAKNVHVAFAASVIFKGIFAFLQILGGVALSFISQHSIVKLIYQFTQEELSEDPRDFIAHYLITTAGQLSFDTQHFAALYLLSHGLLKGFIVINLLREKMWAFPLALITFSSFVAYQLFRYSLTHSIWLLILTIIDLVVIWLTWREFQYKKRLRFSKVV